MNYNMDPSKGAVKADTGKLAWHLLPTHLFAGVVKVLMEGAKKYTAFNWARGMPYSRVLDAARRHLDQFQWGEFDESQGRYTSGPQNVDRESGLNHIDHAIANLVFLRHYIATEREDLDDRVDLRRVHEPGPEPPAVQQISPDYEDFVLKQLKTQAEQEKELKKLQPIWKGYQRAFAEFEYGRAPRDKGEEAA